MIKRILLSLPLWLAYTAATTVLNVIGLVILLPLAATRSWHWRYSRVYPRTWRKNWKITAWPGGWLTWLWGNEEDGVLGPPWWREREIGTQPSTRAYKWAAARAAYIWSALRNPSNNTRFIPGINPVIDPKRIGFVQVFLGETQITLTWQGPFAGLLILFPFAGKTWRFWWGWKLKPQDAAGVSDDDMRKPRCGFVLQFKRV